MARTSRRLPQRIPLRTKGKALTDQFQCLNLIDGPTPVEPVQEEHHVSSYGIARDRRSLRLVAVACPKRERLSLNQQHLTLSGPGCAEPSV